MDAGGFPAPFGSMSASGTRTLSVSASIRLAVEYKLVYAGCRERLVVHSTQLRADGFRLQFRIVIEHLSDFKNRNLSVGRGAYFDGVCEVRPNKNNRNNLPFSDKASHDQGLESLGVFPDASGLEHQRFSHPRSWKSPAQRAGPSVR